MERDGYTPGTPSWVDIGSTDLEVTHAFYTGLFDWERQDAGPPEETGGYGFYTKAGKLVAGYGPAQSPGVWWAMYVDVADAEAIAGKVELNGGVTLLAPMQVMEAGTMAVFADPTGAAFSVWQADQHKGSQVVNEPGAFSWAELMTRDLPAAVAFYQAVFGWTEENGPEAPYKEFAVDGNVVAAAQAIADDMPAEVPAHWNIYFGVADVDAAAARVAELGGTVRVPPFDIPDVGRIAVLGGPHHEGFSIFGYDD
jgi:predicted enzyme related to lactoylglutathione lyase